MTLLPGAPRTFDTRISPFPGTFRPVGHVMCTAKGSARFAYRGLEPAPAPAPACLRSPRFRLALLSSLLSASVVPPFLELPNPHPTCWDMSWLCRAFHSTSRFSPRYSGRFRPAYALPSRSRSRYLVPVGVGGALHMSYGVRYHILRARTLDLPLRLASPSRPAPTRARPRPTLDVRLVMAPPCPCIELVTPYLLRARGASGVVHGCREAARAAVQRYRLLATPPFPDVSDLHEHDHTLQTCLRRALALALGFASPSIMMALIESTSSCGSGGSWRLGAVERGLPRPGQLSVGGADSTSRSLPTIDHSPTCGVPALRRVVHLQHAEKGPLVVHLGTSASPVRARAAIRANTPNMGAHYAYSELHLPLSLMLIQTLCGGDDRRGRAGRRWC
ncbi:hypothetical protein B0H14DRAFT_3484781 [Mycena olivaceomarginata]|nr:hypothetical protein B0H14DRAFT_3484781 [Mycena olivaceomarginata]